MSHEICTFETISSYFHLPLAEASAKLGICATILKKICRSFGIKRWPHRKIRSINNLIKKYEDQLKNTTKPEEIHNIKMEVNLLREKKEIILKHPNTPIHPDQRRRKSSSSSSDEEEKNSELNNKNVLEECYKIMKENFDKKQSQDVQTNEPQTKSTQKNIYYNYKNYTPETINNKSIGKKRKEFKPVVSVVVNSVTNGEIQSMLNNNDFEILSFPSKRVCSDQNREYGNNYSFVPSNFLVDSCTGKNFIELPNIKSLPSDACCQSPVIKPLPSFSNFINQIYE